MSMKQSNDTIASVKSLIGAAKAKIYLTCKGQSISKLAVIDIICKWFSKILPKTLYVFSSFDELLRTALTRNTKPTTTNVSKKKMNKPSYL